MKRNLRARTFRAYLSTGFDAKSFHPKPGQAGFTGIPEFFAPIPNQIDPLLPGPIIPIPEQAISGDRIDKEGYIDLLRFDESGYSPFSAANLSDYGNLNLELRTYCLVRISSKVDASENLVEFRILYSDLKGELLACSMAVVAALKDAFANRTKVHAYGEVNEIEVTFPFGPPVKSDLFNSLNSVSLIRS